MTQMYIHTYIYVYLYTVYNIYSICNIQMEQIKSMTNEKPHLQVNKRTIDKKAK